MNTSPLFASVEELRKRLGSRVTIMGHHYQDDTVIRHCDLRGDSLELARKVAGIDSEHIVFCGVYFMAESAALLAKSGQRVHLPEPSAECSMALMSPEGLVRAVLQKLSSGGRKIIPLAYVNSTMAVKAVVGEYGGSVCTSANARTMLAWAFGQGDAVLFLPDRNLAANTAALLGVTEEEHAILDVRRQGALMDLEAAAKARLLLWPGHCSIHTRFNVKQISAKRAEYPGALVVVHPECSPIVVQAADSAGSTSHIIRYVAEAPAGATVVVGTEINLVERLAAQHKGRVTVLPLVESACTHMAQTTEARVHACLEAVAAGSSSFEVTVPEAYREPAKQALETMLRVCA